MLHFHEVGKGVACGKEYEIAALARTFAAEPVKNRCPECNAVFMQMGEKAYVKPEFPGTIKE